MVLEQRQRLRPKIVTKQIQTIRTEIREEQKPYIHDTTKDNRTLKKLQKRGFIGRISRVLAKSHS